MTETKKILGARIQELRKSKGLKQAKLAEIVCIDPKHMSKIECGRCYPSFELLDKIAQALKVMPFEILNVEHLEGKKILIEKITKLLTEAEEEKVKISYKILKELLN